MSRGTVYYIWLAASVVNGFGATFGTVVPVRGEVADIALDGTRGRLYIANMPAYQINVMNTGDQSFAAPLSVPMPPSTLSLSPDSRYLVVGEYNNFCAASATGGLTIFDLSANLRTDETMPYPVLSVAFGANGLALVVTTASVQLLNPATGLLQAINISAAPSSFGSSLPVPFATYPPNITQASAGVSQNGETIVVMAGIGSTATGASGTSGASGASGATGATGACSGAASIAPVASIAIINFSVLGGSATVSPYATSPSNGPVAVSVDQAGQNYLAGWGLLNAQGTVMAQFPAPTGVQNIGSSAWDWVNNRIFAQIPSSTDTSPVLSVVDTDNLTVRELIQLPENLSGRSVWSSDMNTLYSVSVSGVTVFPMGSFNTAHRVAALQEDAVFQGNGCDRSIVTATINIVDLGGGSVDFRLSTSAPNGITFSPSSGTTPATVQINVDPTAFQAGTGTTAVPLTISSYNSINFGATVRLLISTPDVDQHGQIIDVPGKITDILADPIRKLVYLTRQDKNLILVYDADSYQFVTSFRTGNTPVGMTITPDLNYLIVGNSNSQIDNVYNLNTMTPATPILLPPGSYGRSIAAASNGQIFQIVSEGPGPGWSTQQGVGAIVAVNVAAGLADPLPTLGIYINSVNPNGILAPSADFDEILLAMPNGTVALYDSGAGQWVASRQDFSSLSGAAGTFGDNLFVVDNHLLDAGLAPVATLENSTGSSSGVAVAGGVGLRTTSHAANAAGVVERVNLTSYQTYNGALTDESPASGSTLLTTPVGQIGETILSFVRSVAIPSDQSSILLLSVSGMTVLPNSFDAPTPIPSISAVVNAADGTTPIAPGGVILVVGTGLAPGGASATQSPLPEQLGNVCVTANNQAMPLFNVSGSQIMAQLPFNVAGSASIVVTTPGGSSNSFPGNVQSFAPAIFHTGQAGDQTGIATVVRLTNNELVTFTNPIHPNEMIEIFLTGLAQTSPLPALGAGAPFNPLAVVSTPPSVTLGGLALPVTFAGLVPGEVGVYQIDAYVPGNLQNSTAAPLVITQGGASTTYLVRTVNP